MNRLRIGLWGAIGSAAMVAACAAQEPPPGAPRVLTELEKAFAEAEKLGADGKLDEASKRIAELVKKYAKKPQALWMAARLEHRLAFRRSDQLHDRKGANKHFFACAKYVRRLRKLVKNRVPLGLRNFGAIAIYNEACSFAVAGKHEEALKSLKEAIDWGFSDVGVASKDSDFDSLRKDLKHKKAFEELLEKMKKKQAESENPRVRT